MSDSAIIKAAQVEQEFEASAAVAALADAGISASYKATVDDSLLGLPGAMGCPDSFDIFVPEAAAEEARDILIGIGCLSAECETEETEENGAEESEEEKEAPAPQTLNDLMPDNPVLAAIYKAIFAILTLAVIAVFVWLCDAAIAWFMGLFR